MLFRSLSRHQIVAGAVRSYAQVLDSADLAASGIVVQVAGAPGRSYRVIGQPYRFDAAPQPNPAPAPDCGADTEVVLAEAGYHAEEMARLREAGVMG